MILGLRSPSGTLSQKMGSCDIPSATGLPSTVFGHVPTLELPSGLAYWFMKPEPNYRLLSAPGAFEHPLIAGRHKMLRVKGL